MADLCNLHKKCLIYGTYKFIAELHGYNFTVLCFMFSSSRQSVVILVIPYHVCVISGLEGNGYFYRKYVFMMVASEILEAKLKTAMNKYIHHELHSLN